MLENIDIIIWCVHHQFRWRRRSSDHIIFYPLPFPSLEACHLHISTSTKTSSIFGLGKRLRKNRKKESSRAFLASLKVVKTFQELSYEERESRIGVLVVETAEIKMKNNNKPLSAAAAANWFSWPLLGQFYQQSKADFAADYYFCQKIFSLHLWTN